MIMVVMQCFNKRLEVSKGMTCSACLGSASQEEGDFIKSEVSSSYVMK